MKILVLGGGNSPEREVSLRSAKSVATAAREAGFEVIEADPASGPSIFDNLPSDTVVFPILHGEGGEDGALQLELEKRGLPFLGSDSKSSKKCFDKWDTRKILESKGIVIPKGNLVTKETYESDELRARPHVLKVRRGGSSIGTLIARNPRSVKVEQINEIFALATEAVIEELIEGSEITVPVLDQKALTVIEIRPPEGLEFDYENKYNGQTAEICPPQSILAEVQKKAQAIAEEVHKAMSCRHLSRVDIMIDKSEGLFVLEINTIPGLTDQSLYPKSAKVAGLSMPELVKSFADLIKRDYSL